MISDMLEACRLCMCREQDAMKPIFDQQGLAAKIIWISDLKVYEGDNLPAQICQQCYVRLNSAYYFKEQVIGIDRTLREMLEQVLSVPPPDKSTKFTKLNAAPASKGKGNQKPRSSKQSNRMNNVEANMSVSQSYEVDTYDTNDLQEVKIEVMEHAVIEVDSDEEVPVAKPTVLQKRKPHPSNRRRDRNFLIVNNKPRPNKCHLCPKAFITRAHLNRHMLIHAAGKPIRRSKKAYSASVAANNTFQTNTSYDDNTDSMDFTESSNQGTPISVASESSSETNKNLEKVKSMTDSLPGRSTSGGIACPVCHRIVSTRSRLVLHMRVHTGEKPYSCSKCSRLFSSTGNRTKHQRKCKGTTVCSDSLGLTQPVKNVTPESLPSTYSPTIRLSKKVLTRMAKGAATHDCPHCDAKYSRKTTMMKHVLALHSGRPPRTYPCGLCEKVFSSNGNLTKHVQTFHGLNNASDFSCSLCDTLLPSKAALQWHMKEHVGEQPYLCNICDKAFVQVHHFNEHMANHARDKPFKCDVCSKTFYENVLLVRHMRIIHDSWPEEAPSTDVKAEPANVEGGNVKNAVQNGSQSVDNENVSAEIAVNVTEEPPGLAASAEPESLNEETEVQRELPSPEMVLLPQNEPPTLIPKVEFVESLMVTDESEQENFEVE